MIRVRTIAPMTFALLIASVAPAQEPGCHREVLAMGTRLSLRLEGAPEAALAAASNDAIDECARIESACSTWRPESAWSRLNSAGSSMALEAEWLALLSKAQQWNERTEGAFDPVLGCLLACYGVRSGGRTPSAAELRAARGSSGSRRLHLDPARGMARLDQGAAVEEGGFVKGYALDRMKDQITRAGISSGLLDFGGQLLAFGKTAEVAIADPKDRTPSRFSIPLQDASLASSGFSEHGRHIVDPRSGLLCEDWGSVSVVAASGLDADCISTGLYVMGPDKGLAWSQRHHIAAIFLLNNGQARMSPAFAALHPTSISMEHE